jgi:hypothetical protein
MALFEQLPGCLEKLRRAQEHLNLFNREYHEGMESVVPHQSYSFRSHVDPKTGNQTLELVVREPLPLLRWGALLGDVVHNLRSILDHIIEELTIRGSGRSLPNTAFPIYDRKFKIVSPGVGQSGIPGFKDLDKRGRLTTDSGLHKIRGINRPGVEAFIEGLQPYQRIGDVDSHPLLLLHRLDIMDKHRVLPLLDQVAVPLGMSVSGPGKITIVSMTPAFYEPFPFEDGTEIPGFVLSPDSTPDVNMEMNFTREILLAKSGPGGGRNVVEVLFDVWYGALSTGLALEAML